MLREPRCSRLEAHGATDGPGHTPHFQPWTDVCFTSYACRCRFCGLDTQTYNTKTHTDGVPPVRGTAPFDGPRHHAGYYSDAHAKGHSVVLLLTEALGGLHGTAVQQLRALHRRATRPRADDRTTYGSSRTATASFHTHWLRVISLSIASSLALAITERAESLGVQLIDDPPPSAGD